MCLGGRTEQMLKGLRDKFSKAKMDAAISSFIIIIICICAGGQMLEGLYEISSSGVSR